MAAKGDSAARSRDQILAIGDKNTYLKFKKPVKYYDKKMFKDDCLKRLSLLLLGTQHHPIAEVNECCKKDWIVLTEIEEDNKPIRYQFNTRNTENREKYSWTFSVLNAEAIMHEVRKQLKDENWKTKYMIEGPLKGKNGQQDSYFQLDYIRRTICEADHKEWRKICQYVQHLHYLDKEDKRK